MNGGGFAKEILTFVSIKKYVKDLRSNTMWFSTIGGFKIITFRDAQVKYFYILLMPNYRHSKHITVFTKFTLLYYSIKKSH